MAPPEDRCWTACWAARWTTWTGALGWPRGAGRSGLLDATAAARAAWWGLRRWLAALLTVWADPFGRSRAWIPVEGTGHAVRVDAALGPAAPRREASERNFSPEAAGDARRAAGLGERARRAVAWLYRWHAAPDEGDLRACARRFGLPGVPGFELRVAWAAPPAGGALSTSSGAGPILASLGRPHVVAVSDIRLGEGFGRGERTVAAAWLAAGCRTSRGETGPAPLGGYELPALLRAAERLAGAGGRRPRATT